jgi:hypothetical protein
LIGRFSGVKTIGKHLVGEMPMRISGREKSTISAISPLPHADFRFFHLLKVLKTPCLVIVLLVSSPAGVRAQVPARNGNPALLQTVLPARTLCIVVTNDANSRIWDADDL